MSADDILLDVEDRMDKAIAHLKSSLGGIRTGRANPGLVDSLKVEVYGSQSPMKQLASVGAPEPQQILIRPYDPGTIKDIERAIINSNLGLAPQNDGRVIRINIPPLTTETRKKLVARIKELTEEPKSAFAMSAATATRRRSRAKKTATPLRTKGTRRRTTFKS